MSTGLVVVEFVWHHSTAHPWIPPSRRKRYRDIFYTSGVIACFVSIFVAMATTVGGCKIWLTSFDSPGGTAAAAPPPFRPGNPALCGSHPLVTPYYCTLGDFLCYICILYLSTTYQLKQLSTNIIRPSKCNLTLSLKSHHEFKIKKLLLTVAYLGGGGLAPASPFQPTIIFMMVFLAVLLIFFF